MMVKRYNHLEKGKSIKEEEEYEEDKSYVIGERSDGHKILLMPFPEENSKQILDDLDSPMSKRNTNKQKSLKMNKIPLEKLNNEKNILSLHEFNQDLNDVNTVSQNLPIKNDKKPIEESKKNSNIASTKPPPKKSRACMIY